MQTKLDEAKAELLERAARVAENSPVGGHLPTGTTDESTPDRDTLLAFLQRYYLHTAPEDLTDRDPVDVYGAALSHYRLAENRPQGTANVRVHTPTVEENGWMCSHSVVEVVTDDMPFLVDSVTNELTRQGRGIHVVIHPQVIVRRDVAGKLSEVLTPPLTGELPHDAHTESWIHVEIDRETDRGDLKQITADLLRVLSDAREAVEDWEKMRDAALRMADELPKEPIASDLREQDVEEARELLRWLATDHFTFLGYREYQLREDDSLAAVPGTGLGILRSDPHHAEGDSHPVSPSFERLPADARGKAREHKLLVLTKANSRSTVHRPSYLDYIGVKRFDADGNVVGERRFLGLFSSAAYTESVRRVPVIRRKVEEVLERAGFSPNSHDGRDLLQILETYPRDELFQTPPDELQSIVTSVLYLQERRRLRLYLRQDEYGRYYSALVYLPRDRYTTGVRLRIIDILKEELGGISVDFTAWNTESILSRLHFVVRVPQGTELPQLSDSDKDRIEARLVAAARSWADGFAEALNAEFGEERAAELLRRYGNAIPEGYKADHSPRSAVADLAQIEKLTEETGFALSLYEPVGAAPEERRFKIYRKGDSITLSAVLPVLNRLGVEVMDERPYELRCSDRSVAWIYDFGLRMPRPRSGSGDYLGDDGRERFQDAFAATWTGKAENDGFNSLVLSAGLNWRQAMVLRAYAKYLRQAGSTFSQDYMEDTLRNNVHTTRLLVSLFEARMSPERQRAGLEIVDALLEEVDAALDRSGVVWDAVEALDNKVEAAVQTRIRLHSRRLVERGTRWLLNNRPQPLQLAETAEFFADRVEQVWSQLPKLLRGADLEWYQKIYDELTGVGVPGDVATRVAGFSSAFPTLDIVSVADRMGRDPMDVADVYYDLADRLRITQLMDRIIELPRADRWQSMARASIREDLYAAHAALTADVLAVGNGTSTPEQRFKAWEEKNAPILGRARTTLEEIQSSDSFDLANLSVAMRTMRTLLRAHA
ncbi:hypothetical protein SALBM311S_04435 [Streptomyces alboniger]